MSLLTAGAVGAVAFAATGAFFSDTETSTGNILAAGALDLKIDNTCYYNGQACVDSEWVGGPNDGESCSCTWGPKDLEQGDVFFSLRDLKPGDWEEDTISLQVDNPAWVCLDITTTANDDVSCTEPELDDDLSCSPEDNPDPGFGELAEELNFIFWVDDGDNVFEEDEVEGVIAQGLASDILGDARWALADSSTGDPIPAGETFYIGKFMCFGEITQAPVPDDQGEDPTVNSGFECDGEPVNNASQTDLLEGDIVFYAEQARHNDDFLCNAPEASPSPSPTPEPTPTELPQPTDTPGPV